MSCGEHVRLLTNSISGCGRLSTHIPLADTPVQCKLAVWHASDALLLFLLVSWTLSKRMMPLSLTHGPLSLSNVSISPPNNRSTQHRDEAMRPPMLRGLLLVVLAATTTHTSAVLFPSTRRAAFLPTTAVAGLATTPRRASTGPHSSFSSSTSSVNRRNPARTAAFLHMSTSSSSSSSSSSVPSLLLKMKGGKTPLVTPPPASPSPERRQRTRRLLALASASIALALITCTTSIPQALAVAVDKGEHLHLGQRLANAVRAKTGWPDWVILMVISALPVVELRGGVPVGLWMGIPPAQTFALACVGNFVPVPFILMLLKNVPWLMEKVTPVLEKKLKDTTGARMNWQALAVFVGVPLPGTGAWTGAAIAALFKLSYAESLFGVVVGIVSAAAIMTALVLAGLWGAVAVGGGLLVSLVVQQLSKRGKDQK